MAELDFEIPDDIDLSECPGLVEINKYTPNWKKEMIQKKNQEKIEEFVRKIMKEREQEKKWKNVPEWKRKLLQKKDQEDEEARLKGASTPDSTPKKAAPKANNSSPAPAAGGAVQHTYDEFNTSKPRGDIVPAAMSIDPEELAAMPPWKRELLFKRDKIPVSFGNEYNPDEEEEEEEAPQGVPVMADS